MAFLQLQYCSSATGKTHIPTYDDVNHVIVEGVQDLACSGGIPSNSLIYEQVDGNTTFKVYSQNTYPFAYVGQVVGQPCAVTIDSVNVGNASNESSNDGSIIVNASGPYTKEYSKDDGLNYQSSNQFTGLTRGTYKIRVRSHNPEDGMYCYDSQDVVVGFNAILNCELKLGNITTSNPTTAGGTNGSITINTVTDPIGLQLEYRLDAGVWQDSAVFNNLNAGTKNVQVRYKNYTTCTDNRNVTLIDGSVVCNIFITDVAITHEQSKFADDGKLEIIATSTNGPITYSKDNGATYQASNIFQNLPPGTYLIRVKDAANCEDARTVVVEHFKTPHIDIPLVNGLRFVVINGPGIDNSLQNFDNTLFVKMRFPGVDPGCYDMPRQQNDTEKIQWRSNFSSHTLKLINAKTGALVNTISTQKAKDFTRQTESISASLADAGAGKTQVFFENGLPEWAKIGQDITLTNTGQVAFDGKTFEIMDIIPGTLNAVGYVVLIINVAFPGAGIIAGTVDVEYDIEAFDVHEATIIWGDYAVGTYYLLLTGTDAQFPSFTAQTEPISLASTHEDTVLLKYSNTDNAFKVFYETGVQFMMRAEGVLRRPQPGGTEVNHEESNGVFVKLYEQVTRNPELLIGPVPPYLAEKLALICAHDSVIVNGVEYGKQDEKVEITYFDDETDPLCHARVQLRQAEFIAENTDDAGDVDVPQTVLGVNGVLYALNP